MGQDEISRKTILEKLDKIQDAMNYFDQIVTNVNTDDELEAIAGNIGYTQAVCEDFKEELTEGDMEMAWVNKDTLIDKHNKIDTLKNAIEDKEQRNKQQHQKIKQQEERIETLNEQLEHAKSIDWSKYE